MLNDREDKYEGDDTEYHFSDEEINYDMDASESSKSAAPVTPEAKASTGGISGLLKSKRMIISGAVFIVLLFVVYEMVTPSTTSEINVDDMKSVPVATTKAMTVPESANQGYNTKAAVSKMTAPSARPATALKQNTQTVNMPVMPSSVPSSPAEPMQQAAGQSVDQSADQSPVPDLAAYMQTVPSQQMPTMPEMPAIPAQSSASGAQPSGIQGAENIDNRVLTLETQNQRLMEQLRTQYDQRIQEYQDQNKSLQNQVETLSTKVASMENQLTDMMSTRVKKLQEVEKSAALPVSPGDESETHTAPPKIPYNVQAIIPGRAWLKSDSGETITVAEGDVIKGVGRVTRIDPYDGIVEIKSGKRVITLSYGNGG